MGYRYEDLKPRIFTDEGQRRFLEARDHARKLLEAAGAFMMEKAMLGGGDAWDMLARVDRMVELGELVEVTGPEVAGQHRVFVRSFR